MAYTHQINILEAKLKQLEKGPSNLDTTIRILQIQAEVKKLRRLEWIEKNEVVDMGEDR